jgi:hypothetical protein
MGLNETFVVSSWVFVIFVFQILALKSAQSMHDRARARARFSAPVKARPDPRPSGTPLASLRRPSSAVAREETGRAATALLGRAAASISAGAAGQWRASRGSQVGSCAQRAAVPMGRPGTTADLARPVEDKGPRGIGALEARPAGAPAPQWAPVSGVAPVADPGCCRCSLSLTAIPDPETEAETDTVEDAVSAAAAAPDSDADADAAFRDRDRDRDREREREREGKHLGPGFGFGFGNGNGRGFNPALSARPLRSPTPCPRQVRG